MNQAEYPEAEQKAVRDFMAEVDAIRDLPRDEFAMELKPILRRLRRHPLAFALVASVIREQKP